MKLLIGIREALTVSDFETAAKSTHALKGSAANVGAGGLAEAAQALEQAVRSGAPWDREIDTISSAYDATKDAFETLLRQAA